MIIADRYWKSQGQGLRKSKYYIRSLLKKSYFNDNSCLCTRYLTGPPFVWITAVMQHGMEVITLWHCWGVMEDQVALIAAFRSSALLGLVFFHLPLEKKPILWFGSCGLNFAGTETPWSLNQFLVPLPLRWPLSNMDSVPLHFVQTLGPWFPNDMQNFPSLLPQPREDASNIITRLGVAWLEEWWHL